MAKYKNILLTIAFLFFLGIQDGILGQTVLKTADNFFFWLISALGAMFWGALLFLPRFAYILLLLFQSVLFGIVFIWHKYFKDAMPFELLWQRFSVGLDFAKKSTETFSSPVLWLILGMGLVNIAVYLLSSRRIRKIYAVYFLIPLSLFYFFVFNIAGILRPIAFDEDACKYLGYKTCWLHELACKIKYENKTEDIIKQLNKLPPAVPAAPTASRHVYVIQVETLVYDVLNKRLPDGREITPYLNRLSQNGKIYHIKEFKHTASANTDFAVNLGMPIPEGFINHNIYNVFYEQIAPEDIYPYTETLAQKAQKKGFSTFFYHNYLGTFFNRRPHVTGQGYENIFFSEEMDNLGYQEELWGYSDKDLTDFILKKQKGQSDKALFTYIITVSSHADFILLHNPEPLLPNAKEPVENYYNAINFVDKALKKLITESPEDSLFFIFGDHDSEQISANSVPFIIYSKQKRLSAQGGKITTDQMIALIHAQVENADIK